MKTVLSVLCWIGIAVMISGCDDGDDGGSAGGYGEFPEVSYIIDDDTVTCYNADSNVRTGAEQICIWNCANYRNKGAVRKVILYFDEAAVEEIKGYEDVEDDEGNVIGSEPIIEYSYEMALVKEDFDMCVL